MDKHPDIWKAPVLCETVVPVLVGASFSADFPLLPTLSLTHIFPGIDLAGLACSGLSGGNHFCQFLCSPLAGLVQWAIRQQCYFSAYTSCFLWVDVENRVTHFCLQFWQTAQQWRFGQQVSFCFYFFKQVSFYCFFKLKDADRFSSS